MGLFSKDIQTLDDLYAHTLRDIYYAEKKIVQALSDMIDKASDDELRDGFSEHLEQTKNHVRRLEKVFDLHGLKAKSIDCPAIDGITEEADDVAGDVDDPQVLDAALIAAAQAVEHYEISRYGSLIAWAKLLGNDEEAAILAETLAEEKETDEKLSSLAESKINLRTAA